MAYEELRTWAAHNHSKWVISNARALKLQIKNAELLDKLKTLTWKHSDLEEKSTKQGEDLFKLNKDFSDETMVRKAY